MTSTSIPLLPHNHSNHDLNDSDSYEFDDFDDWNDTNNNDNTNNSNGNTGDNSNNNNRYGDYEQDVDDDIEYGSGSRNKRGRNRSKSKSKYNFNLGDLKSRFIPSHSSNSHSHSRSRTSGSRSGRIHLPFTNPNPTLSSSESKSQTSPNYHSSTSTSGSKPKNPLLILILLTIFISITYFSFHRHPSSHSSNSHSSSSNPGSNVANGGGIAPGEEIDWNPIGIVPVPFHGPGSLEFDDEDQDDEKDFDDEEDSEDSDDDDEQEEEKEDEENNTTVIHSSTDYSHYLWHRDLSPLELPGWDSWSGNEGRWGRGGPGERGGSEAEGRGRLIVVGDVHGMGERLRTLLRRLEFDPSKNDTLIMVGDLIVKHPDLSSSLQTLSVVRTLHAKSVRGNHDQTVLEWRRWMEDVGQKIGLKALGIDEDELRKEKEMDELEGVGMKVEADWGEILKDVPGEEGPFGEGNYDGLGDLMGDEWKWLDLVDERDIEYINVEEGEEAGVEMNVLGDVKGDEEEKTKVALKQKPKKVKVPKGWKWGKEHWQLARRLSRKDYRYLLSLPLSLHISPLHAYIVHAGLLPPPATLSQSSSPVRQSATELDSDVSQPSSTWFGAPSNDLPKLLKSLTPHRFTPPSTVRSKLSQSGETSLLVLQKHNREPFTLLNMRGVKTEEKTLDDGAGEAVKVVKKVTKSTKKGVPWMDLWGQERAICARRDGGLDETSEGCAPVNVIYGHWAADGVDIRNRTFGLDSGCVYGRQLSALVVPSSSSSTGTHTPSSLEQEIAYKTSDSFYDELVKTNGKGEKGEMKTRKVQIEGRDARVVSLKCVKPKKNGKGKGKGDKRKGKGKKRLRKGKAPS